MNGELCAGCCHCGYLDPVVRDFIAFSGREVAIQECFEKIMENEVVLELEQVKFSEKNYNQICINIFHLSIYDKY